MLSVEGLTRAGLGPVSFAVEAAECIAVRGPSGAGKTLLLRAIADLDPNEGRVSLGGEDRAAMPATTWRRRVGYVPAEPGWWANTPREHFSDVAAATAALESLRLPLTLLDRPVAHLSTGERQRLALLRALLLEPKALLLDEPTSGLDPDARAAVEAVIATRRDQGVAVVWVTHDDAQARRLAFRTLHVEGGRVTREELT